MDNGVLTTVDLAQVGKLAKGVLVTERHVLDAVVDEGGHCGDGGRLLSSARASGGDEETGGFTVEGTGSPELTGTVDESLKHISCQWVEQGLKCSV